MTIVPAEIFLAEGSQQLGIEVRPNSNIKCLLIDLEDIVDKFDFAWPVQKVKILITIMVGDISEGRGKIHIGGLPIVDVDESLVHLHHQKQLFHTYI